MRHQFIPTSRLVAGAIVVILAGHGYAAPDRHVSALNRAKEYLKQDKFALARREVDKAIAADPSNATTYLMAMSLYAESKRYADQAEVGELLIEQLKTSAPKGKLSTEQIAAVWSVVAYAHWQAKDIRAAEKAYLQALRLAPRNPVILNDAGYFYADVGIKPREALRLTEDAAALMPSDGNVLDSLGWALYRNGRYGRALEVLKRAVELQPNAAELRYHLGAVYVKLGQRVEARVELSKALLLDRDLDSASRLLRKL